MADHPPPPLAVSDVDGPEPDPRPRRRRLLVVVAVLVVGVLVAGVVWARSLGASSPGPVAKAWTLEPYEGLGAWVDAFDWSHALGGDTPVVDEHDMEAMAALGVQTVFIQTSHMGVPDQVVLEQDRLEGLIDAAHKHGMSVVAWYLPTLEDVDADLARLKASAELPVDGLAVDIESTSIKDPAERNARLLDLSASVRNAFPDKVIGAITLSAVHLQVVNPSYWPDFPWAQVADDYDVILPMAYWSIRLPEWRDGNKYVGENIDRIREATGRPDLPIHVIGGIADGITVDQVQGMLSAIDARDGILGASLYDWATSSPQEWATLSPLRARNPAGADEG